MAARGLRRTSAAALLLGFGFESRWKSGCLSVVIPVFCQVELLPTVRSVVERSPNECGVSLIVIKGDSNLYTYNELVDRGQD